MNELLKINTQEQLVVLIIVIMVIYRTALSIRVRRGGKLSNIRYAVKMFLISDLGIISMVVIYIITASLNLSFEATSVLIVIFLMIFYVVYKRA